MSERDNMERNQLFCDGMILQANKPVRVFGAGAGTATIAIGGKTATVQTNGETWLAELPSINQECWKAVQTAQERISQKMENVHTVKCADFSETDDIHPITKVPLAERIAAVLLTL